MDLGRTQSLETLVRHQQAVEQRLSSSLREAELVESALTALDRQLDGADQMGIAAALRASARALLAVAAGLDGYDVTVVPHEGRVGVRVRNTLFGLQADVVPRAAERMPESLPSSGPPPRSKASDDQPDPRAPGPDLPIEAVESSLPLHAATTSRKRDQSH